LLNAVERTGAEQVAMSLSPAKITADGKAQSIATATVTEEGKPVSGDTIAFASTDGGEKVGAVTETSPGTYATTITASHTVGEATIIATDNSDPLQPSGRATLTQGAPTIEVSVTPTSMKADGRSTAAVKVKATGVNGEVVQGDDIAVTTTGPAAAGLVRDNGDGTYTTDVTAFHQPGKVTVTATDISTSPNVSASTSLKTVASKGEGRGKHKHRKKRKGKHKKRRRKSKGKKKGPHHARRKR
jgi:hypothetical protein